MKNWKRIIALFVCAVVLLGGVLALCLWQREPQGDTDPNAPFVDLPARTKEEIKKAVAAYWETRPTIPPDIFWYGEEPPDKDYWDPEIKQKLRYDYGISYYGTFSDYHIVISPRESVLIAGHSIFIAGYTFHIGGDFFLLLAYKDGVAVPVEDLYKKGVLTEEQIGEIYQCCERFKQEIYPSYRQRKEKVYEYSQKIRCLLSVCGVAVILAGVGVSVFCCCRKRGKQRTDLKCRKMIPKEKIWKTALCAIAALALLGSGLAVWLVNRSPEDTDPNAPFKDLPKWTKRKVLSAIEKELSNVDYEAFWYGDAAAERRYGSQIAYSAGVRYFGTFNGYHIVMAPLASGGEEEADICEYVGIYDFHYDMQFELFAYKDGVAVYLAEAYEDGLLQNIHLFQIYHIFQGYNKNIYTIPSEEK